MSIRLDTEKNTLHIELAPDAEQGSWDTFHESVFVRVTDEGKVTGIDILDADRILLPETLRQFGGPSRDIAKPS